MSLRRLLTSEKYIEHGFSKLLEVGVGPVVKLEIQRMN